MNNKIQGAGNKPDRLIIGAVLINHKLNLSDTETIEDIRENPYMQYMLGLSEFTDQPVFDLSLFVTICKRLGSEDFNLMSEELLKAKVAKSEDTEKKGTGDKDNMNSDNNACPGLEEKSSNKGLLKADATCADAEVRFLTDLDLLHDGISLYYSYPLYISAKASPMSRNKSNFC